MKLCQLIAVESKVKQKSHEEISELYKKIQKPDLMTGLSRIYQPINDEDPEVFPSEQKKVQFTAELAMKTLQDCQTELIDNVFTKDFANSTAKADVKVGESILFKDAPVPFLIFLEKKLNDFYTFVKTFPVLDPAETWTYEPNQSCFVSAPKKTHKNKKVTKVLVLVAPTDKHPGQAKEYTEDVLVGFWNTLNYSGAIPAEKQKKILSRIETLLKAVKFAREEANSMTIEPKKVSGPIFNFIFGE